MLMFDCLLLLQRQDIVLQVVQWVCRSTQSELMQLSSRGFLLRTHEGIHHLDMYWNAKKWALAHRSGYSA